MPIQPLNGNWLRLPQHLRRGLARLYFAITFPWVAWHGFQIYDIAQRSRYVSHTAEMSKAFWSLLIVPIGAPILFLLVVWVLAGFRKTKLTTNEALKTNQHQDWKEDLAKLREKIAADIVYRPDIVADEFFRTGVLNGKQIKDWPRLDEAKLTEEQKRDLPADYYTKGGINPDEIAGVFAYTSGKAMIERLVLLEKNRRESNLKPKEYFKKAVDDEIKRRMQQSPGQ
jgi:hypothetical protein